MISEFNAYKKFTDLESAENIKNLLEQNNIDCHIQDNLHSYVKVIGYNQVDFGITLNIRDDDFPKADKILENYYSKEIKDIDKDYYLYEFTDEELKDIISNPYEWGQFDFQLAKQILKQKGIEYSDTYLQNKKDEKINELSKLKKVSIYTLVAGYFFSIICPAIGLVIGFLIVNNRNLLPNGQKVYVHSENGRKQGKIIIGISILWTIIIISDVIIQHS